MKIISKILLTLLMVFTLAGSATVNKPPVILSEQSQAVTLNGKVLDATLHQIYEQAWIRATQYTLVLPNEMPKFSEENIDWTMQVETWEVDHDRNGPIWYTDMFETGTSRVLAWYKTDPQLIIVNGLVMPVSVRIEMQVTMSEIEYHTYAIEGILVHEFIHYIQHMRIMNLKGWMTMWPGDGHNYMNYLKYVKGYDVPVNKY